MMVPVIRPMEFARWKQIPVMAFTTKAYVEDRVKENAARQVSVRFLKKSWSYSSITF